MCSKKSPFSTRTSVVGIDIFKQVVSGSVVPPLEGVKIQIFGKDKTAPVQTLVTQENGVYKVGPLDGKVDYR